MLECHKFIYQCLSGRGVSFISSYRCFHFAPVVCPEMWKHDWVTPWPKCHAGDENRRIMNISYCLFLQFYKAAALDPSLRTNTVRVWDTESCRQRPSTYLSRLKRLESHVFFFPSACMFLILLHPAHTHTKMGCVTLSHSNAFGNSTHAVLKWCWL